MCAKPRKSYRDKLRDSKGLPAIEAMHEKLAAKWGPGTLVIPAPIEVDELMNGVPEGKVTTINKIREALARKHGTTMCCPLTTGIFASVAAHAAEEDAAEGKAFTPYWRTLKSGGELNEKFPGGVEAQASFLRQEGHVIEPGRGKKPPRVKDFERVLVDL